MENGVRSTSEEFPPDIERRIRQACEGFSGDTLEVGGNLQQRPTQAIDRLGRHRGDARLRTCNCP